MTDQPLLTLREVAHKLGVDYNTVYRLVRRGELPATRIGGVYRMRAADFESYYIEQQSARIATQMQGGGNTPQKRTTALRCEQCLRLIRDAKSADVCPAIGCNAPVCAECRAQGQLFCQQHTPTPAERVAAARLAHASGQLPVLVTATEARRREINFLQRFRHKVEQQRTLPHPDGAAPLPFPDPAAVLTLSDELLPFSGLPETAPIHAPCNERVRYTVPAGRKRSDLVLEARVIADRAAHLHDGFESQPADSDLLLSLLLACGEEQRKSGATFVLGLAATAGWSADALAFLTGAALGEGWSHSHIYPCLIDLQTRQVLNENVPALQPFLPFFRLTLPEEEVRAVEAYVQAEIALQGSLTSADLVHTLGVTSGAVLTAFQRLTARGGYFIEDMPEIGLVIGRFDR